MKVDIFYVEIRNVGDQTLSERLGPMMQHRAERLASGANLELNHDKFFTQVVENEKGEFDDEES